MAAKLPFRGGGRPLAFSLPTQRPSKLSVIDTKHKRYSSSRSRGYQLLAHASARPLPLTGDDRGPLSGRRAVLGTAMGHNTNSRWQQSRASPKARVANHQLMYPPAKATTLTPESHPGQPGGINDWEKVSSEPSIPWRKAEDWMPFPALVDWPEHSVGGPHMK